MLGFRFSIPIVCTIGQNPYAMLLANITSATPHSFCSPRKCLEAWMPCEIPQFSPCSNNWSKHTMHFFRHTVGKVHQLGVTSYIIWQDTPRLAIDERNGLPILGMDRSVMWTGCRKKMMLKMALETWYKDTHQCLPFAQFDSANSSKKKSSFMQSLSIHHGSGGIQEYLCPWVLLL